MNVDIRQGDEGDIQALYQFYTTINKTDKGYFEAVFEKDCVVFIAEKDKKIVGFGVLNFEPKYSFYQKLDIPEIQDVNVLPECRQQGIATELIAGFENIARDQGAEYIGISVGLTKDFGPAQRLYYKLGYMPDGNGVTNDRNFIDSGQNITLNDDVCLMMLKDLSH